jgi:hypothetical protein
MRVSRRYLWCGVLVCLAGSPGCGLLSCNPGNRGEAYRSTGSDSRDEPPQRESPPRDAVSACRELAPEDPYTSKDENGQAALEACRKAARSRPDDPEIHYLVGISALQTDNKEEAIESFRKSEKLGFCKALYFLGEAAWYQDHDERAAEQYYTRGAECGDTRAAHEIFTPASFAASAYPAYIEALYRGEIEKLNHARFFSASYVSGFYEALNEQYLDATFNPCWITSYYSGGEIVYRLHAAEKGDASNIIESRIYQAALPAVFQLLFPEQARQGLEEIQQSAHKAGHADLIRMVQSSKCGALLPYKVVSGIKAFANARRSLYEVAQQVSPDIHSIHDLLSVPWRGGN